MLSTFEKIDSKEGKVEIFFKPDIRQNTWRYKNSEKIQDVDVPECQYPNEFLKQFSDFDPEVKNKKLKHKYTLQIYKSHYNEEMFEMTEDYEFNVH